MDNLNSFPVQKVSTEMEWEIAEHFSNFQNYTSDFDVCSLEFNKNWIIPLY